MEQQTRQSDPEYLLPAGWKLESQDVPPGIGLAYNLQGPEGAPLVVIAGGISSHRWVGGQDCRGTPWWPDIVGPGAAIDTTRFRVLSFDYLGGNDESWGPRKGNWRPSTPVTTKDQARALRCLVGSLGFKSVRLFVGASYGGMVGLTFATQFPETLEQLCVISAAHRSHPMAAAWRHVQQLILKTLPTATGVSLARALAMTTYRSPEEFTERFDGIEDVAGYLDAQGMRYSAFVHPEAYYCLSQSINSHHISQDKIAQLQVPTILVGVTEDRLVPIELMRELADLAPSINLIEISSKYGHDAFLKEIDQFSEIISGQLRSSPTQYSTTRKKTQDCKMTHNSSNSIKLAGPSQAVRGGIATDTQFGAIVPPVVLSTNFSFAEFGQKRKYDYTRSGNPTRDILGETLANLEQGAGAVVTSTGMSAVTLVAQILKPEETIIISHDCYGGTYRLFKKLNEKGLCRVVFADLKDEATLASIQDLAPRIVWVETPSNPLLRIYDVTRISAIAHAAGALCVVDNTFLSPALQQPILLGADVVVHSTTKYLNGHSDIVGGAVVSKTQELHEELTWWSNCLGITGSPFDSYLTLRGVRTLFPRLKEHNANAAAIAHTLAQHPAVSKVYYPGLSSHPDHALASRQQRGFGGMLSFELLGGPGAIKAFLAGLELFSLAESLGGVESLVAHPATMTHASMDEEGRRRAGISDSLLRLSVGIEDALDLVKDICTGLDRAHDFTVSSGSRLLVSEISTEPQTLFARSSERAVHTECRVI